MPRRDRSLRLSVPSPPNALSAPTASSSPAIATPRGFGTAADDAALAELGVRHIGVRGSGTPGKARQQYERSRPFRRMRNWRVGIEARISLLKRGFGFRRTRLRRLAGAQIWAGLGVFATTRSR